MPEQEMSIARTLAGRIAELARRAQRETSLPMVAGTIAGLFVIWVSTSEYLRLL